MNGRLSVALVCLVSAALTAPAAQADTTLTMKDAAGRVNALIEVKGHMLRMSAPGEADYVLFDAQREVAIHVNSRDGQYVEVDRATVDEMADSVARVQKVMGPQIAMLREQLKNLPPEQRAMIEQRMGGMVDLGAMESQSEVRVTTVKRGSDNIAGFACQRYDVMSDRERVADVCMATEADTGISKTDFATVNAAMQFMRDMAERSQKISAGFGAPQLSFGDIQGVPVSISDLRGGREYRLAGVSGESLEEARFNAYRSLKKRDLPQLP